MPRLLVSSYTMTQIPNVCVKPEVVELFSHRCKEVFNRHNGVNLPASLKVVSSHKLLFKTCVHQPKFLSMVSTKLMEVVLGCDLLCTSSIG